mgnify:FL=1
MSLCATYRALAAGALLALSLTGPPPPPPPTPPPPAPPPPRVEIEAQSRLTPRGSGEALPGDTRLAASRIIYDGDTGALTIEGPITVTEGDGSAVIFADAAELSGDLRDGLLRSARLVLERQLQLAATQIARTGGRYTQLDQVVASSCEVCAANPTPLWQIRARRIVHDAEEQQLYFDDARFEVYGVPVLYFPRLRLPDPALERATGFLTPRFTQTDELGFGVKLPYFVALGPSRDVTVTPYLSANSVTLEGRYRQAFRSGRLQFDGALSQDTIREGETRGYLFTRGAFALGRGYTLRFNTEFASDADYLDDYGYSDKSRLENRLSIFRAERDLFVQAEARSFYVPGEDIGEERRPSRIADAVYQRRFTPPGLGGAGRLRFQAHGFERPSDEEVLGRDVGRLEAELGWRRSAVLAGGLVFGAEAQLLAQYDRYTDDPTADEAEARLIPTAAVDLRWPWAKHGAQASHIVEPVAQIVWTGDAALTDRPNEESRQVTLDAGNLFALSRFPAGDRVEAGLRANLGIGYTRHDPAGWSLGLTAGRVIRADDPGQFDGIATLEGARSDWLLAAQLDTAGGLRIDQRALFDDDLDGALYETRFGWQGPRLDLAGTYTWLDPSPAQDRPDRINQWRIDGGLQVNERWRAEADIAYDLDRTRAAETAFGLEYTGNCVSVDVGLRQRFTDPDQTSPSTSIDLQIALAGFGGGAERRPRNSACLR